MNPNRNREYYRNRRTGQSESWVLPPMNEPSRPKNFMEELRKELELERRRLELEQKRLDRVMEIVGSRLAPGATMATMATMAARATRAPRATAATAATEIQDEEGSPMALLRRKSSTKCCIIMGGSGRSGRSGRAGAKYTKTRSPTPNPKNRSRRRMRRFGLGSNEGYWTTPKP